MLVARTLIMKLTFEKYLQILNLFTLGTLSFAQLERKSPKRNSLR